MMMTKFIHDLLFPPSRLIFSLLVILLAKVNISMVGKVPAPIQPSFTRCPKRNHCQPLLEARPLQRITRLKLLLLRHDPLRGPDPSQESALLSRSGTERHFPSYPKMNHCPTTTVPHSLYPLKHHHRLYKIWIILSPHAPIPTPHTQPHLVRQRLGSPYLQII